MGADMAKGTKLAVPAKPDAMQAQFVMQDTPVVCVGVVPSLGVFGTIDHAVPFQERANVAGEGAEAALAWPTALHVVALKQETPVSPWLNVVEVFGLVVIVHAVPFQVSIRFWSRGPAALLCPTASQKPVPAHETARRRLPVPVVAGGVVTSVQAVPFHISLKGTAVGVVSVAPT